MGFTIKELGAFEHTTVHRLDEDYNDVETSFKFWFLNFVKPSELLLYSYKKILIFSYQKTVQYEMLNIFHTNVSLNYEVFMNNYYGYSYYMDVLYVVNNFVESQNDSCNFSKLLHHALNNNNGYT